MIISKKRKFFNFHFNTSYSNFHLLLFAFLFFSFQSINAQSRASISGIVTDQFGNLPGAKVYIEGTDVTTTTDVNGAYNFDVEEGEYIVTVAFVMYKTLSKSVTVKVGENGILDFLLETGFSLDQPVSLGTRAKPTSSLETTVSVDVISPQDISNSSQIELSQVLQRLVPSFHSTNQTISDGTDHIDPGTLRGLGPDQVLVLINGKRRHNSSLLNVNGTIGRGTVGTDFNAIPLSSIERVEVLRDGATSQYGSDAIAGVINIILKEQVQTIDINALAKTNTEGDGTTTYFSGNFGFDIGEKGFINLTGEYRNRDAINRAGNYLGNVYSNDPEEDAQLIAANNFYNQTGYEDQRVMEIGAAATQNLALFFNGSFGVSDNANLYFHGGRNYREGIAKGFYRFPKDQDRVVLELFPNGFSPEILTDIQDNEITLGFKGVKNGWNLDFSHSIGVNDLDYTVNNSNNASLGIASPRTFYSGGFVYKQNTTNIDISKPFDWLEGANVAFGGELRIENYQIIAGEEASYIDGGSTYIDEFGDVQFRIPGAQVFPGIRPENELSRFRTNNSLYVDLELNVTDKLLLKGATRYELYNDFGGQLVWKLSGRYKINDKLTFKSGLASGFRAPSLHQVYFQSISTQFIDGNILQVGTFNNESPITNEAFQIESLKPELSNHINAGLSGKINENITFNLDYYFTKIKDRIVLSGRFAGGYEDLLQPFNVGAAQFFVNAIDSKTSGFDVALNYKTPFYLGKLNASLSGNFTQTKIDGPIKESPSLIGQGDVLFNREEVGRVERAQPKFKIISRLLYEMDKFKVQLNNTYFGEVEFLHISDGDSANWVLNEFTNRVETRDQTFTPKLITDLSLSYKLNSNIEFTLGGNNIFNVYPDKHKHSANLGNGSFIYSRRVQQFGLNGANLFTRLLFKL